MNAPVCSAEMRALAQTGKHIKVRLVHGVWCVTAPLISVCECVNLAEMSGLVLHLLGHSSHLSFRARKKKKPSNGHSGFDFNRVQVECEESERGRDGWKVGQTQNCDSHDIILNVMEKHKNSTVYFPLLFSTPAS